MCAHCYIRYSYNLSLTAVVGRMEAQVLLQLAKQVYIYTAVYVRNNSFIFPINNHILGAGLKHRIDTVIRS